jgi:hypothetical protein
MLNEILKERESTYGNFHTQANLSQTLKSIINQHYVSVHGEIMPNFMAESLAMICHKIARITNGNPTYVDSWQDIAGYSQLVVDILNQSSVENSLTEQEEK